MNKHAHEAASHPPLTKADPSQPVFKAIARDAIVIKAGTTFGAHTFHTEAEVLGPIEGRLIPGADYVVTVDDEVVGVERATAIPAGEFVLGGFHFAPGGNATARVGGDDIPAINPCSLWDIAFRPACPDPRGMALISRTHGAPFWCDIYLTGANHLADGTSRFGVTIADGEDRPLDDKGKRARRFDYETAQAAMAAHGKGLLSAEEFFAAAFGVTEKTAADRDPETTRLDAPRTSRFGIMQATGNLWIWGHDGDPDQPRASILGGSWLDGGGAGSRYAALGHWPGSSSGILGARGRSDHLQPE